MAAVQDTPTTQQALIQAANTAQQNGDSQQAWSLLRQLSLTAFGELLLDIPAQTPALQAWLPTMASDEVQRNWTGTCGMPLLLQSRDFVASVEKACMTYQGHGIEGNILDYGCGWGRIMRLMLRYAEPEQLYGVDPWDTSIDLCQQHKCMGQFAVSDYIPTSLPFAENFDLIYAFSVFTHLSEKTANAVMKVLRTRITDTGMLVITMRPPEYWDVHQGWREEYSKELLKERHETQGFAFMPHYRDPIDGDITYGDTSMTLDYIRQHWTDWKIAGTDFNPSDPWQILVFLQPV